MKKGLSAEIITGNIGCKVDKPKSMMRECFEEFYGLSSKTEDVDYVEVTNDLCAEPNILPNPDLNADCSLDGLKKSVAIMVDNSPIKTFYDAVKATKLLNHVVESEPCIFKPFDDPAHVAFLGHDLESK